MNMSGSHLYHLLSCLSQSTLSVLLATNTNDGYITKPILSHFLKFVKCDTCPYTIFVTNGILICKNSPCILLFTDLFLGQNVIRSLVNVIQALSVTTFSYRSFVTQENSFICFCIQFDHVSSHMETFQFVHCLLLRF